MKLHIYTWGQIYIAGTKVQKSKTIALKFAENCIKRTEKVLQAFMKVLKICNFSAISAFSNSQNSCTHVLMELQRSHCDNFQKITLRKARTYPTSRVTPFEMAHGVILLAPDSISTHLWLLPYWLGNPICKNPKPIPTPPVGLPHLKWNMGLSYWPHMPFQPTYGCYPTGWVALLAKTQSPHLPRQ